jgi:hypothetical protein
MHMLPLSRHARRLAARVAARYQGRSARPVVRSTYYGTDTTQARAGEVRSQCGPRVAARTIVVELLDTAYAPSDSVQEVVVAVGRFARHGWHQWLVLH